MREIVITGAAGRLGGYLRSAADYRMRLLDIADQKPPAAGELVQITKGSYGDGEALAAVLPGADAIVHLGGISSEAPLADILTVNVQAADVLLSSAVRHRVRTVVLASSHHAAGFYSRTHDGATPLPADVPPRPDSYYGMGKAAMEAMGRMYADRFGLRIVNVRIGSCSPRPTSPRTLPIWLSPRDWTSLVAACLENAPEGYSSVWGISANTRSWLDGGPGRRIGYEPLDDSEIFAESLTASHPSEDFSFPFLGDRLCTADLGVRR
jgi:uronate dehydrogenase